jgi:hypothetical protein
MKGSEKDKTKDVDLVNRPPHYHTGRYETIKVIDAWNLNFNLGNAVKYISRAKLKHNTLEDLKKARWYLNHEIRRHQRRRKGPQAPDQKRDRDSDEKPGP